MLGAFFVQFWVAGLVKSYGVLFVEILETFPSSSTAVASWIPAILSALCLALAPLSSALCQRFSCRSVVFVGGLFCTFGLTLSYFATSLYHLLFTFGILTGLLSLMSFAYPSINKYVSVQESEVVYQQRQESLLFQCTLTNIERWPMGYVCRERRPVVLCFPC